ncbi:MAG: hypothetical protein HKN87_11695 [Saprospiraceae bacterium]|nr:hypothetical protein [Saprospiraceae bacterium]
MKISIIILLAFSITPVIQAQIQISNLSGTEIGMHAAGELERYLGKMYTGVDFLRVKSDSNAHIQFVSGVQAKAAGLKAIPTEEGSFKIFEEEGKLFIVSPNERGLLNATYALLEKLGCRFYISGDVVSEQKKVVRL